MSPCESFGYFPNFCITQVIRQLADISRSFFRTLLTSGLISTL